MCGSLIAAGTSKAEVKRDTFVVAFKSNSSFDDFEPRLRNLVKEFRTNHNIPKTQGVDYIYIEIDFNSDIYVELDLKALYENEEYTSLTAKFDPPKIYKYPAKSRDGVGGFYVNFKAKYFKFEDDDERMIYEMLKFVDSYAEPNNILYLSDYYPTLDFCP